MYKYVIIIVIILWLIKNYNTTLYFFFLYIYYNLFQNNWYVLTFLTNKLIILYEIKNQNSLKKKYFSKNIFNI